MKYFVALIVAAFASISVQAAVAEGENILLNGNFDAEQVEFPDFWVPSSSKNVLYLRSGGPGGKKAAVVLKSDGTPGTVSVRQQGMTLVAGETYRLSGFIRTKGFKSRHAGVVVHNYGWDSDIGFKDLPTDSEWTFVEKTFTMIPSTDKTYGLALFAVGLSGEMHCAGLKLEAISERARGGSTSQIALISAPRLVPYRPLLNKIPRIEPELTFKVFGAQEEKTCECLVSVEGNTIHPQTVPLKDGKMSVTLAGLPCGNHLLHTLVRHRETGATIVEGAFPISIIDVPVIDRSGSKALNNLVTEVLNQPLRASSLQTFTFVNPRDGWVFVALSNAASLPGLIVTIDGKDTAITASNDRREAFRELPTGVHRISVVGASAGARVIVRSIAEIFDYPPCTDSYVKENGSYGWEFMKRHILHAVTTLNGGVLPGNALPEAKARGLKWLANFNVAPFDDSDNILKRMEKHAGLTQQIYDGFTSDEIFFGTVSHDNYTKALWRLRNPENRLVYTWIVGKPAIAALHTDLISAALNASKGRGRLLFEAYCRPQADEKAAAAYLDDMLGETIRRFNTFFPNAAAGTGFIFGNFNQLPIISLEYNPEVDYKYYLDMQVNMIANSTNFSGLAATGYWGTYYGDEEMVRWSFMLMRHYAVEGNRDMLSTRFGFKYNPAHIVNGDFANGMNNWESSPATEGSIRTNTIPGYGKNSQGRWGSGSSAGDTVCVMTRHPDTPNRISQTAKGLAIGKLYSLQFITANLTDVLEKKHAPRRYGIEAELEGAAIISNKCFVHIDQRKKTANEGKINLHHIIFRATSSAQTVTFNDTKAAPGETLIINFVQLKPYFGDTTAEPSNAARLQVRDASVSPK